MCSRITSPSSTGWHRDVPRLLAYPSPPLAPSSSARKPSKLSASPTPMVVPASFSLTSRTPPPPPPLCDNKNRRRCCTGEYKTRMLLENFWTRDCGSRIVCGRLTGGRPARTGARTDKTLSPAAPLLPRHYRLFCNFKRSSPLASSRGRSHGADNSPGDWVSLSWGSHRVSIFLSLRFFFFFLICWSFT